MYLKEKVHFKVVLSIYSQKGAIPETVGAQEVKESAVFFFNIGNNDFNN